MRTIRTLRVRTRSLHPDIFQTWTGSRPWPTFVTVVETEGFASAARKLNVSPSVISRVMTELEEHLGVRLLTRTTRVVRITDAGASFYEDCR